MNKSIRSLPVRENTFPIKNKFSFKSENDFHIICIIHYVSDNACKIIIRRMDDDGPIQTVSVVISSIDNTQTDEIVINGSENEYIAEHITHVNLEKVVYAEQKIPKRIIQTDNTNNYFSRQHYNVIQNLIDMNPEYEYIFFTDPDIRKFIKNNIYRLIYFALEIYDILLPGAYKADFFRYVYLFLYGGVYIDSKMMILKPLREIILPSDDNLFCMDSIKNHSLNSIIMVCEGNIYMEYIFKKIYANVIYKFYGENSLHPTGSRLFFDYTLNQNMCLQHITNNEIGYKKYPIFDLRNKEICIYKIYNNYYNDDPNIIKNRKLPKYDVLYNNKMIYLTNKVVFDNFFIYAFEHHTDDKFNFNLASNQGSTFLNVYKINSDSGWTYNLIVTIIDDNTNEQYYVSVGSSNTNTKSISL